MDQARVEAIALRQIEPGERLLWSGAPAPGSAAVSALPASLLGVPFSGFAAFWMWGASSAASTTGGPGQFFPLFGVPFLLIGLGMLLAPLWTYLRARGTVYVVTERRALIIVGGGKGDVSSHGHADMRDLTRMERPDGSGSVYFASRSYTSSRGFERRSHVGFVGIPDVRRVERLIREHIVERGA